MANFPFEAIQVELLDATPRNNVGPSNLLPILCERDRKYFTYGNTNRCRGLTHAGLIQTRPDQTGIRIPYCPIRRHRQSPPLGGFNLDFSRSTAGSITWTADSAESKPRFGSPPVASSPRWRSWAMPHRWRTNRSCCGCNRSQGHTEGVKCRALGGYVACGIGRRQDVVGPERLVSKTLARDGTGKR